MKIVKKFEFPTSTFGQSTHDWPAILSAEVSPENLGKKGDAARLVQGEDFDSDPTNFSMMIRNQAAKRHLKAKVTKKEEEGKVCLYVQTCKMTDEEAAAADARIERSKESGKARREAKKAAGGNSEPTVPMQATA